MAGMAHPRETGKGEYVRVWEMLILACVVYAGKEILTMNDEILYK